MAGEPSLTPFTVLGDFLGQTARHLFHEGAEQRAAHELGIPGPSLPEATPQNLANQTVADIVGLTARPATGLLSMIPESVLSLGMDPRQAKGLKGWLSNVDKSLGDPMSTQAKVLEFMGPEAIVLPAITSARAAAYSRLVRDFDKVRRKMGRPAAISIISNQVRPAMRVRSKELADLLKTDVGETAISMRRHEAGAADRMSLPEDPEFWTATTGEAHAQLVNRLTREASERGSDITVAEMWRRTGGSFENRNDLERGFEYGGEFYPDRLYESSVVPETGLPDESFRLADRATDGIPDYLQQDLVDLSENVRRRRGVRAQVAYTKVRDQVLKNPEAGLDPRLTAGRLDKPKVLFPSFSSGGKGANPDNLAYTIMREERTGRPWVLFGRDHLSNVVDNRIEPLAADDLFASYDGTILEFVESGRYVDGKYNPR